MYLWGCQLMLMSMIPIIIKMALATSFKEYFSIFLRKIYVKNRINSSSVCRTGATIETISWLNARNDSNQPVAMPTPGFQNMYKS